MLNRRELLKKSAVLGLTASLARPGFAQAKPKVVIVGGGAGGGSVLRALAASAGERLDVTLIEPETAYTACFRSNLYLGGFQPLGSLEFTYEAMQSLAGVALVNDRAERIDRENRTVALKNGASVPYDLLVLSPGIALDYGSVPGWSKEVEERVPHAWKGGAQLPILKKQIDSVPNGGLIVMLVPQAPYRCPPGPYERVSMIAHALTAARKTQAHIMILDEKESFTKQPLFQQGWEQHYPGMIEWLPPSIHGGIKTVNAATMTVETDFEDYTGAALINVIPRQTAGQIAAEAGLTGDKGYCPIDAFTMKSRMDPRIFVVGDACVPGDMPKSAFAANSQAKVAAQAIGAELLGDKAVDAEYRNACWSLIDTADSVKIGGAYKPTAEKIKETSSFISKMDESPETRREAYDESVAWYARLTGELFG